MLSFHFVGGFLCYAKLLSLFVCLFVCFYCLYFRKLIQKKYCCCLCQRVFCLCFPLSFIESCVTFRSLIHFEFIFVYGVKECSNFILLHVALQFSQHQLLKRQLTTEQPYGKDWNLPEKISTTKDIKKEPQWDR